MRKRKERQSETLIYSKEDESGDQRSEDSEAEEDDGDKSSGFFACYLLTSLCPRYKGHTYIGFTVNPRRRIRQHNGELCSGASRTKKKRPWEMVLCIYGFPTNVTALQFEWAWQHPVESLAVRKAAIGFKSLGGLANKIKLAYTMLTLPVWNNLNLNVNFFSTKYTKHYAGCPTLPSHMKVYIRSMDELPCYIEGCKQDEDDMFGFENGLSDDDEEAGKSFEDATIPVLYSTNHHNNEEEAFFVSENYEQPQVDDKEPERTQVSDSADHQNNEEEAYCVSDDENYEQPSYINKGMWDYDNDDKEHKTIPVSISANHHNNGKEAYCVSDDENYEQPPSCANKDMWDDDDDKEHETVPVSVSADHQNNGKEAICVSDDEDYDIPKRSYTEPDCSHVVSPTKLNENDGSKKKISGSSGEIEVVDLFTPSPENRTRKKRGGSVVCPEIIDLTESPICV